MTFVCSLHSAAVAYLVFCLFSYKL